MLSQENKKLVTFVSFVALLLLAAAVFMEFIFTKIDVSAGDIPGLLSKIANIVAYSMLAVNAFIWAWGTRKSSWKIVWAVAVVVLIIFLVLGWV